MDEQAIRQAREHFYRREEERKQAREARRQTRYQAVRETVQRMAPDFPAVRVVYLYGSLVQPGRFRADSDVDIAVVCDDLAEESRFWGVLEQALQCEVDVRPCTGTAIADVVGFYSELVYERQDSALA
jgi:predicted nucleotidyltransferase